jgi:NAD(P) transhydrogenase subunit alpha
LTQPGKTIEHNGVTIHAPLNLPSTGAVHARPDVCRNIVNLVTPLVKNGHSRSTRPTR